MRLLSFGALATPDAASPLGPLLLPSDAHSAVSLVGGGFCFAAAVVDGCLAVGGSAPTDAPPPLARLVGAAAGYDTLIVVDGDGGVHGAGWDSDGQASGLCGRGDGGGGSGGGNHRAPWTRIRLPAPVIAVAAGERHALALDAGGTVWGWGSPDDGAVGAVARGGGAVAILGPAAATVAPPIVALAAGGRHSVAVEGGSGARVWCWGCNLRGQTGAPPSPSTPPGPVPALDGAGVVALAAGAAHTVALTAAGEAFAWGEGIALGRPGTDDATTPTAVPLDADVTLTTVSCGAHHTVATDAGGGVWVWGVVGGGRGKKEGQPPTRVVAGGAVAAVAGWWHGVVLVK